MSAALSIVAYPLIKHRIHASTILLYLLISIVSRLKKILWTLYFTKKISFNYNKIAKFEASRGAAARSVTVKPTGCGFDPHWRRWNIYLNLYFHFFALVLRLSAALSFATQHAMPPEFGRKWGTEYLNNRFPLPTLRAGYSVKLIIKLQDFWSINYSIVSKKCSK